MIKKLLLITFFFVSPIQAAIYITPTEQFKAKFSIAALYIEDGDRILLLHRQEHKSQGNRWGIPAGKIESNETPLQAVIRETYEETGFDFSNQPVDSLGMLYVEHNEKIHFFYHMFRVKMPFNPGEVKINFEEHKGFTWVVPKDAIKMQLIDDEADCIQHTHLNHLNANQTG